MPAHPNDHCCHGSLGAHMAEMAVVASCLLEHQIVNQVLEAGAVSSDLTALLERLAAAHDDAGQAIEAWRAPQPPTS